MGPGEVEYFWPIHQVYQQMMNLPVKDAKTGKITHYDFLCPFTVASGKLHRVMMPLNAYPGEEGRAAEIAEGRASPKLAAESDSERC
eukprot:6089387-Pyramimonas_sp.AAC.1